MLTKIPWYGLLELSITVGVGFYASHKLENPDLAFTIWFIGAVLLLHRILFNVHVDKKNKELILELETFKKLFSIIDLDIKTDVCEIDKIRKFYMKIQEAEFQGIKKDIVSTASEKLENLLYNKETENLSSSSYYKWIFESFENSHKGDTIKAVSVMHDLEWNTDNPNEVKFFNANINASAREVTIERIFLIPKESLTKALENNFIEAHTKASKHNIKGYFSNINLVSKHDFALLKEIGDGFIIVNDKVILIDIFSKDGDARGKVAMRKLTVKSYIQIFNDLKNSSTAL